MVAYTHLFEDCELRIVGEATTIFPWEVTCQDCLALITSECGDNCPEDCEADHRGEE